MTLIIILQQIYSKKEQEANIIERHIKKLHIKNRNMDQFISILIVFINLLTPEEILSNIFPKFIIL